MTCSGQGLISLDQALALYVEHVRPLAAVSVPLAQAHYRVLAQPVYAPVDLPLFDQSAVDGYALRWQDITEDTHGFSLMGEIRAGHTAHRALQAGEAMRIFTGGKLPEGADTVARQEIVQRYNNQLQLTKPLSQGADVRYRGEELQAGSLLAAKGSPVNAGVLAACAMAGVSTVSVHRQPRIAVIITGDEVSTNPSQEAQIADGHVFDANGPLLNAWLNHAGLSEYRLSHIGDHAEHLREALHEALNTCDLVLTSGGVSVGDYDFVRPVSMQLGAQEIFWQVAQKPGKPLYFARYQCGAHQSYLLGLPGNPAAVFTSLPVHVQSLVNVLTGKHAPLPQWQQGLFCGELKADSRERLLRVTLNIDDHGQVRLYPLPKQQSHMLSNLMSANALMRVASNSAVKQETLLPFLPLH